MNYHSRDFIFDHAYSPMCRAWWFDDRGSEVVFTLCSIRWLPLVILQIFTHCSYFDGRCSVPGSHWCFDQRLVSRSIYLELRQQQTCYCAKRWSSKYKLIEGAQWLRHNQWSRSQALIKTLINVLGIETAQRCIVEIGRSLTPRKRPPQLNFHNSFTPLNSCY